MLAQRLQGLRGGQGQDRLEVTVIGEFLEAVRALAVALIVGLRRGEAWEGEAAAIHEEDVVVFQLGDGVIEGQAEGRNPGDALTIAQTGERYGGIAIESCEVDWRGKFLVDLGDDDGGTEAGEDGLQHKIVVRIDIETQDAEMLR